jgi:CoA:oxalate CoA-transferase
MIDISLLDTVFSFVAATGLPAEYEILGILRQQQGNEAFYGFANTFQTSDGHIYVAVNDESAWRRFSKAIGHEEFASDPRFIGNMNRYENRHLFLSAVEEWMAARPKNEVVEVMQGVKIPCGAVLSVAEAMNHPQIKAREMLVYLDQPGTGLVPCGGVPFKYSQTPGKVERKAPKVGEHNEEIYCGLLGFSKESFAEFQREGIV